ncbi:MAG: protein kinase [Candidatus Obscuribacterales bacterium]|nr:protein kinase [Candidatus Obscuribacterales bacterium]
MPDLGEDFQILELLGSGAMGVVYRVKQISQKEEYAVKVMRAEVSRDKQLVKRFKLEAKAVESLDHPNLIPVFGQGKARGKSDEELPYLLMGLSRGESLKSLLKKGERFDKERILNIMVQVAEALAHAHANGIIHRDIKPSNIMIEKNELGEDHVKVLDFSIAKVNPVENRVGQGLTMTGEFLGTPAYMSPESCIGRAVDERSDLYSFGCVFYELLMGAPPFAGHNPVQIIVDHINTTPASLPQDRGKGSDLERFVMKLLRKEPSDRYQSIAEMLVDLKALKEGKKVKIKEAAKVIDEKREAMVAVGIIFLTLCLVLAPGIYFLGFMQENRAYDPRSHIAQLKLDKAQVSVSSSPSAEAAGPVTYELKNEFKEVIYKAVGRDRNDAIRGAVQGAVKAKVSLRGVHLDNVDLSNLNLEGADFAGARFLSVDLTSTNLKNVNFMNARLSRCRASNADFENCDFSDCNFQQVALEKSHLANCKFQESQFFDAILNGADCTGAKFVQANFRNSQLLNTAFADASIEQSNFTNSPCGGADFSRSTMYRVSYFKSKISNVRFADSKLNNVSYESCFGTNVDFNGCVAEQLSFKNSSFTNSDFRNSKLNSFISSGSNFEQSVFSGAEVSRMSLHKSFFDRTKFEGTVFLDYSEIPDFKFGMNSFRKASFKNARASGYKNKSW